MLPSSVAAWHINVEYVRVIAFYNGLETIPPIRIQS